MSYLRFFMMIGTSTVVMFGLMYLNTYALEHVLFSETRTYMALIMGATMAIVMLSFMLAMYKNKLANVAIFAGSVVVFSLALFLVRSQVTVGQTSYMRAMIPHHSIAIMTSERASIRDPRVRKLADEIIDAQEREIAVMKYLIRDLETPSADVAAASSWPPPPAEVVQTSRAIREANVSSVYPESMTVEEYGKVVPQGPQCAFSMTAAGMPVLVIEAGGSPDARGVMKLNGKLVELRPANGVVGPPLGAAMAAEGIAASVVPAGEAGEAGDSARREAALRFRLDGAEEVGFRGFHTCSERLSAQ